jgi:glucose-6-phosphate 1-dehydrogenase
MLNVRRATFRAQHEGYRSIPGVAPDSNTETFFKVRAELKHRMWRGVPFYLSGGKRLGAPEKEIIIVLKHTTPCLCPRNGPHHTNVITIRLEPKEEILIEFWSKKPGLTMETEPRVFHFLLRDERAKRQYVEEYARILLEGIRGDQMFFISTREVKAMWRFADPILKAWKRNRVPLHSYAPDSKEVLHAARHVEY